MKVLKSLTGVATVKRGAGLCKKSLGNVQCGKVQVTAVFETLLTNKLGRFHRNVLCYTFLDDKSCINLKSLSL